MPPRARSHSRNSFNESLFLKKRGCPGWGANPGPLEFIYFLILHHFTAEPQRLPYSFNESHSFVESATFDKSHFMSMWARLGRFLEIHGPKF
jgi:hypothetical protein